MTHQEILVSKKLPLTFDLDRLREGVHAVSDGWKAHFATEYYRGDWRVLPLLTANGAEDDLVTPWGAEFKRTRYLESSPYFQEVLRQFHCPLLRVRLHRLEAGARVKTHIDYLFDDHLDFVRIHVPIITNESVEFVLNGERLDLDPGWAWFTEVAFPHRVSNRSDEDRIHLILDCAANGWLESALGFSPRAMRIANRPIYQSWDKKYRAIEKRRLAWQTTKKALKLAITNPREFLRAVARRFSGPAAQ